MSLKTKDRVRNIVKRARASKALDAEKTGNPKKIQNSRNEAGMSFKTKDRVRNIVKRSRASKAVDAEKTGNPKKIQNSRNEATI